MTTARPESRPTFAWNAGGWFGSQLGCTLWLLVLGIVLIPKDRLSAVGSLAGFLVLNAWGALLWRGRDRRSAHAGLQFFLLGVSVVIAAVAILVNVRGASAPPEPGALVSTYVPLWVIAFAPAMMLLVRLRRRSGR